MKITYYILIAMMSVNVGMAILQGLGIAGVPIYAFSPTQWEQAVNATGIVESYDWEERQFYDTGAGLGFLWNSNVPIIESFQGFLQSIGVPTVILNPIKAFWRFIWIGFVISMFSGRDFMP